MSTQKDPKNEFNALLVYGILYRHLFRHLDCEDLDGLADQARKAVDQVIADAIATGKAKFKSETIDIERADNEDKNSQGNSSRPEDKQPH